MIWLVEVLVHSAKVKHALNGECLSATITRARARVDILQFVVVATVVCVWFFLFVQPVPIIPYLRSLCGWLFCYNQHCMTI